MPYEIVWSDGRDSETNCPAKGEGARYSKNCPRDERELEGKMEQLAREAYSALFKAISRPAE